LVESVGCAGFGGAVCELDFHACVVGWCRVSNSTGVSMPSDENWRVALFAIWIRILARAVGGMSRYPAWKGGIRGTTEVGRR
jgi:hypothetical protein